MGYTCIDVHTYIYTERVCVYIYIYIYFFLYTYIYMFECTYVYIYIYIYITTIEYAAYGKWICSAGFKKSDCLQHRPSGAKTAGLVR